MTDPSPTPCQPAPYQKERRHRRFDLQFPVCLSFPSGGAVHKLAAISKNVSIGGLLLRADDQVPPRTRVSLTMEVKGSGRPVRLAAKGQVVRVEALGPGAGFAIAVECRPSITEMARSLSAAS